MKKRALTDTVSDWLYDIRYISFSGGGVKGYSFAGALLMLDEAFRKRHRNLYKQLKGCSGSSVGAVFALWTVLGLRGHQLQREVLKHDLETTMKDMSIDNLVDMYGLNDGVKTRQLLFDMLELHTGNGHITFRDLYHLTRKNLTICVTNISTGQPEYHSYLTTPDQEVWQSLLASIAVPLIWAPVVINGDFYIDGGLTDNLPFSGFPPEETLLLEIQIPTSELTSLRSYVMHLASITVRSAHNARLKAILPHLRPHHFTLRVSNVSFLDFSVSTKMKHQLIREGAQIVYRLIHPDKVFSECMKMITQILFILATGDESSHEHSHDPSHDSLETVPEEVKETSDTEEKNKDLEQPQQQTQDPVPNSVPVSTTSSSSSSSPVLSSKSTDNKTLKQSLKSVWKQMSSTHRIKLI